VIYGGWQPFPFSEDATMSEPSARSRSDAAGHGRWAERLERSSTSNHTVVAFCTAEGVFESNY
jgi:hypothetical protein